MICKHALVYASRLYQSPSEAEMRAVGMKNLIYGTLFRYSPHDNCLYDAEQIWLGSGADWWLRGIADIWDERYTCVDMVAYHRPILVLISAQKPGTTCLKFTSWRR